MFQQVLKDAILAAHPVGSIYESTDSTSPEVLFGGTWETMEAGRVLVSAGTASTASTGTVYNAGSTGGEEATGLSIANLPPHSFSGTTSTNGNHSHTMSGASYGTSTNNIGRGVGTVYAHPETSTNGAHSHTFTTNTLGSGVKHNNMMPYEVIYRWKRTA